MPKWLNIIAGLVLGTSAIGAVPAYAGGNIFLTGHDADYHGYYGSTSAQAALTSELNFVTAGSALPVLVFDNNNLELSGLLSSMSIAHTTIDPSTVFSDSLFDITKYSAFLVASNQSCGGCDLSDSDLANIATHGSAINAFFNAGGGILGLAAAADPLGNAYVPEAAVNGGGFPPEDGFVETAAGTAVGLVAENGDATHNYFPTPGTFGLSSAYQIAETNSGNVESIFVKNGSIVCTGSGCIIHTGAPEPASWALMISGFGMVGAMMRSRRRTTLLYA